MPYTSVFILKLVSAFFKKKGQGHRTVGGDPEQAEVAVFRYPTEEKNPCSCQKEIYVFISNYCIMFPFLPGVSVARGKKGES